MTADEQRVAAFLIALREGEERFPHGTSGGYVEDLEATPDYDDHTVLRPGATIDGWWTVDQLAYALDAVTPTPAPRVSWRDDPRWYSGALSGALVIWLGDLIWGMLT